MTRWHASLQRGPADRGMTLVELVVAMGIFSVVLAVATVGIRQMVLAVNRTADIGDSTTEVQRAFQRLDRTLRYADQVSALATAGSDWEFWYRLPSSAALGVATPTCYQWRYVAAQRVLQVRSWQAGTTAPSYGTIASRVTAATATPTAAAVPFTSARVPISITSQERGAGVTLMTTFVARNTKQLTPVGQSCTV